MTNYIPANKEEINETQRIRNEVLEYLILTAPDKKIEVSRKDFETTLVESFKIDHLFKTDITPDFITLSLIPFEPDKFPYPYERGLSYIDADDVVPFKDTAKNLTDILLNLLNNPAEVKDTTV